MIVNKTNTTIYSSIVDAVVKTGTGILNPIIGSTLNEKYHINITSDASDIPTLGYYGVGLSPESIVSENDLDLYKYRHSPTSIDLFRPVPFIARDANVGLTDIEENTYRIKVRKEIDNKTYILCYLKKIDFVDTEPTVGTFELNEDGNYVMSVYDPEIDATKEMPVDNDSNFFIGTSQSMTLTLTDIEIANIKDAVALLYPELASELVGQYIGELAIYHGVEKPEQRDEASKVQAAYFIQRHFSLDSEKFKYILNIGGMTPRIFG